MSSGRSVSATRRPARSTGSGTSSSTPARSRTTIAGRVPPAPAATPTHLGAQVLKLLSLFEMLEVGSAAPHSPALEPLARAVVSALSRQAAPSR